MNNKVIIQQINENKTINHFFLAKEKGFSEELSTYAAKEDFSSSITFVREVSLKESYTKEQDITSAIADSFWTPVSSNNINDFVLETVKLFKEKSLKTDYLYFKNAEVLFNLKAKEKTKILSCLQTIAFLSGVRFLFIGDVELYKILKKHQRYFMPFATHNLDASKLKNFDIGVYGSSNLHKDSVALLGGARAIVRSKKKKQMENSIIEVVPTDSISGDYVSLDKEKGILFWNIDELAFTAMYSKEMLLEAIRDEIVDNNESEVYVIRSDNKRFLFHRGFHEDGTIAYEEYCESDELGSQSISDIDDFVNNQISDIFSITALKDNTRSRVQMFRQEVAPLVIKPFPEEDILYSFTVIYRVENTNLLYFDTETITKYDLDEEGTSVDEVCERVLSDTKKSILTFDEKMQMIKKSEGFGFVSRETIKKLHILTPDEEMESYVEEFTNIEPLADGYKIFKQLNTCFNDKVKFVVFDNSVEDDIKKSVDNFEMIPFAFFVSEKNVRTSELVKSQTKMTISGE